VLSRTIAPPAAPAALPPATTPAAVGPSTKPVRIGLEGTDRAAVLGDGSKFVVVGGDRATLAIRVGPYYVSAVDAADGKPLNKSDFNANPVFDFAPAADGRHVLFWGAYPEQVLRVPPFSVWDVAAPTRVSQFGEGIDYGTRAAALSPDGSRAVSAGPGMPVKVWDARTGTAVAQFETGRVVESIAVSRDASVALLGGGQEDEAVTLLDLLTGREIFSLAGHHGAVTSVSFSADEATLLSTSADGTVRLWDRRTGRELRRLRAEAGVASAAFDPTGRRVLARMKTATWRAPDGARVQQVNDLRLWDLAAGVELARFTAGEPYHFMSAGFAAGGREVVAASEYRLHRWAVPAALPQDAATPLDEPRLPEEADPELFASPAENVLVVGYLANADAFAASEDNTVTRWAVAQGKQVSAYATAAAGQLRDARSVSSDGRLAVSVSRLSERKVTVWELASGLTVAEPEVRGSVIGAAFTPDASLVAVGVHVGEAVDSHLAFFRTAGGSAAGTVGVPGCSLERIAFAPDGNTVAVIGLNETSVEVFELDTAKRTQKLMAPGNARIDDIAFSGNGSRILAWNFQTVIVWDAASAATVAHETTWGNISAVAISPDGRRLLIGDENSDLHLWDIDAKRKLAVLGHHRRPVTSVAISPDGKTAFSSSRDQTVRGWSLPP
jgi:WD40 repeat protein